MEEAVLTRLGDEEESAEVGLAMEFGQESCVGGGVVVVKDAFGFKVECQLSWEALLVEFHDSACALRARPDAVFVE